MRYNSVGQGIKKDGLKLEWNLKVNMSFKFIQKLQKK